MVVQEEKEGEMTQTEYAARNKAIEDKMRERGSACWGMEQEWEAQETCPLCQMRIPNNGQCDCEGSEGE